MDPTASSRRPPAGRTRDQPIVAERGDEPGTKPGESESSSGGGPRPKRRRKETAPSPKPDADFDVAPAVEKPAEMPKRRRKGRTSSIPPAGLAPDKPDRKSVGSGESAALR